MNPNDLDKLPTLNDCVHCGLCLPACPTYAVTGKEVESPRGRIAALRLLAEERSELTPALAKGLDDCLVCRACESHCPSGISMEELMAGYRRQVPRTTRSAGVERTLLRHVIGRRGRTALGTWGVGLLAPLLRRLPLARLGLPSDLPRPERCRSRRVSVAATEPTEHKGTRGSVALLQGCITEHWFRRELAATARVLRHNGYAVHTDAAHCCGALHKHAGLIEESSDLASRALELLDGAQPDYIVLESAGCAAHLAEQDSRVVDPFTLLHQHGWEPPTQPLAGDWALAPPCHHQHGAQPTDGLHAVLDATLEAGARPLPGPDHCCGAAGFYMLRNPDFSAEIGAAARARFEQSGARGLLTGNPGCLLRWESLLPATTAVEHPISILDRAYREGGDYDAT